MHKLTFVLFAVAVAASAAVGENAGYVGALPGIDVEATRYEAEDIAWSGYLPGVDVIATRQEPETKTARSTVGGDAEQTSFDARYVPASYEVALNHAPKAPRVKIPDMNITAIIPCGTTFSGNYQLPPSDTIDEDVTISGGNARIEGVISGDLAVLGGTVDISGTVQGDVAVLGGNLDLTGTIESDGAVFGGNVKNRGKILGDLHIIGGTVYLDSGSVVEGNISMVGGTVERDTNAVVLGRVESVDMDALEKILPRISKAFRLPRILPAARIFPRVVFLGMLIVLFVFHILVALIFPNAVDRVRTTIDQGIWPSVGIGIGVQLLFAPIIVVLAISIIGIPLIALLPLAIFVAALFGVAALAMIAGERICKGFNWKVESPLGKLSIGWLGIMLIPIITLLIGPPASVIGLVIAYVATTIGVGGVIFALFKREPKAIKK